MQANPVRHQNSVSPISLQESNIKIRKNQKGRNRGDQSLANCASSSVSPFFHREKIENEATQRLFFFTAGVSIKQMDYSRATYS
jgi:hypothetical protein